MKLPSVFVIGDSISIDYDPYLRKYLKKFFLYSRKQGIKEALWNLDIPMGANGGDSSLILEYFYNKNKHREIVNVDYLLFNCGLHDIKTDPISNIKQISSLKYKNNLCLILKKIKKIANHIIWINTTPIDNLRHNTKNKIFYRYNEDVIVYNNIAKKIMEKNKIPIIDLYSFTLKCGKNIYTDHVHFKKVVCRKQGKYISDLLIKNLRVS